MFSYSESEWTAIEEPVIAVREKPLSTIERMSIEKAAARFLTDMEERSSGAYLPPKKRAELWLKAAKLAEKAETAYAEASKNRYGDGWREVAALIIPRDLSSALIEGLLGSDSPPGPLRSGILKAGDVSDLLSAIKKEAESLSEPFFWGVAYAVSISGRLDPPVILAQHVLWLWTDFLGGELRYSRHPETGEVGGPLARYLLAILHPLMKEKAPSIESIPDIVARQRSFYRWLDRKFPGGDGYLDRASMARGWLLTRFGLTPGE